MFTLCLPCFPSFTTFSSGLITTLLKPGGHLHRAPAWIGRLSGSCEDLHNSSSTASTASTSSNRKSWKSKRRKEKTEKRWKSAAPSQVQPSQCPSERSKALESNSSLDMFQTNHQGSVAWIDRWVPIRIIRQNYVRFGDRIENAVRAAQLSKTSRQLWRCISMEPIALDIFG